MDVKVTLSGRARSESYARVRNLAYCGWASDHYFDVAKRLFTVVMLLYNVYVLYSSMEERHFSRMGEFKLKSSKKYQVMLASSRTKSPS